MNEKSQDKVPAPTPAEKKAAKEVFDPTDPAQTRSGGPRVPDPNAKAEPVPVHSPDLADNPAPLATPPGGRAPVDIARLESGDEISEKLRLTDKADVLVFWLRQERASAKPRQDVVEAIRTRLREVQGDPISE